MSRSIRPQNWPEIGANASEEPSFDPNDNAESFISLENGLDITVDDICGDITLF